MQDELISMTRAAKQIGMTREHVKTLAIRHRIAIRWGGTDRKPILKVSLAALRDAINKERYIPPQPAQRGHRRHALELDPAVRC